MTNKHKEVYNESEYIGLRFTGFKFKPIDDALGLWYNPRMDEYIGSELIITGCRERKDTMGLGQYVFDASNGFTYPADIVIKNLIIEKSENQLISDLLKEVNEIQ